MEPRSLLIASPRLPPLVTRLSDIGERGAIDILARIYDRGQPIGLGHDCGVVEWGDDYLVVTTDVVNRKTHIPAGATAQQIGWDATPGNLGDNAASGARAPRFLPGLSLPPGNGREFLPGPPEGEGGSVRGVWVAGLGGGTEGGAGPPVLGPHIAPARGRERARPLLRRRLRTARDGSARCDPDGPHAVFGIVPARASTAHDDREGRGVRRQHPRDENREGAAPGKGLGTLPFFRDSVACHKVF